MRESSPRSQMLAIGLRALVPGERFRQWPLHVTLVPWFERAKPKVLGEALEGIANATKPIKAALGERALFGANNDTPVWRLADNPALMRLHLTALNACHDAGGRLGDYEYVSYKYRPHVSMRREPADSPPQSFLLDHFALIGAEAAGWRRVEACYRLGSSTH